MVRNVFDFFPQALLKLQVYLMPPCCQVMWLCGVSAVRVESMSFKVTCSSSWYMYNIDMYFNVTLAHTETVYSVLFSPGKIILLFFSEKYSLIPRPYPVFQCCTLKNKPSVYLRATLKNWSGLGTRLEKYLSNRIGYMYDIPFHQCRWL